MNAPYVVIMAGGSGERFWPLSRIERPKQLLPIVGDRPMLRQTVDRLGATVPIENVFVITHIRQRPAVLEACPQLKPEQVIGEPVGRDTAAAIALATILIRQRDPEAVFAVLPADQVIHDIDVFQTALEAAFHIAQSTSALITFGIPPAYPATGYGYIQRGTPWSEAEESSSVYTVERFVEKPDSSTAQAYLDSGQYYWNAGQFVWKAEAIAQALVQHTPHLWQAMDALDQGLTRGETIDTLMAQIYPTLEKISIDYAVMEKADSVLVIESPFDWDDVGEWPAIARHCPADEAGNTIQGKASILQGKDNIIVGSPDHRIALIGVDDLIVVQTPNATLVCPKSHAQAIKDLVREIGDNPDWQHVL